MKTTFALTGLDCPDCASKFTQAIKKWPGINDAQLNFMTGKLHIEYDPKATSPEDIKERLAAAGYGVVGDEEETNHNHWLETWLSGLAVAAAFLAHGFGSRPLTIAFSLIAMVIGGSGPLRYVLQTRAFDMHLLMTMAVIGAAAIGEWLEGATVIFLFSLGESLEAHTMDKTRRSISNLMELAPPEALVKRGDEVERVPIQEIQPGEIVLVKPGDSIPVDGQVLQGNSSINQGPITGESMPVDKGPGDPVYAGTINGFGYLEIKTTKRAADTTLAQIVHLVEEAQNQQAPVEKFVDVFAKYYTPAVILLALLVALVPPVFFRVPLTPWLYRGLALLVVACPCALVISTPVAVVAAIGRAARQGILIKGGAHLEALGKVRAIALDKTGTLTYGRPQITDIYPLADWTELEILQRAATLESGSEHPIATAIGQGAKEKGITPESMQDFQAHPGLGVSGTIAGVTYYLGRRKLFSLPIPEGPIQELEKEGKTVMILGTEERLLGLIAVADSLRPTSAQAIDDLRRLGIQRIVMLTGDNPRAAETICRELGIDDYQAELLPADKVAAISHLQREYGLVAMVGDGINDAPALAQADIGVAMGAIGSDTALQVAQIALMGDDLRGLAQGMHISRKALQIIKQNISFSLFIKALALLLLIPGWLTLWLAILSDTGATLLVVANGMRLLINGQSFQTQQSFLQGQSSAETR
ncbi:MAG: heavy metal translocating P-type ATPase [Limnochordia bacterium]|jgi:Cd2+/Zn2+-exporting ATPase